VTRPAPPGRTTLPRSGAAAAVAILIASATLYAGIHWGSTTAGGADSYGYVTESGLFLNRHLTIHEDIIQQSPWPNAADTWAPLGYRASPRDPDAIVPLYAPGLPIMMAAAQSVGGFCAAFVVVPLCGALTVWLTFVLGQQVFARGAASAGAAALVASSPVFLYQLMNPMSDVPATSAWTLAVVLSIAGWPAAAGMASGIALMIRPNLAVVAIALLIWLTWARRRPARFMLGVAPFVAAIAAINASLYESALVSGYGTLHELYSFSYWWPNVRQFVTWTMTTQTPIVLLASLYVIVPRWCPPSRVPSSRLLLVGVAAAVKLSYLFYQPFDAWWYLRFLLPMWPIVMVLTTAGIDAVAGRLSRRPAAVVAGASALLALNGCRVAVARDAFAIGRGERRYVDVARFIEAHTDAKAVVLALQHSGTLRLYAGRLTLRFDQLDPAWLDRAMAFLDAHGRHPYIVLEGDERLLFTRRFAGTAAGALDDRPFAQLDGGHVVVYDAQGSTVKSPLAIAGSASRKAGWRCDPPERWPPPIRLE
jgi:hypothetical protein